MDPVRRVTGPTVEVLELLIARTEPAWGLLVAKETGNTPAAVYSILNRLESGGWIVGDWEDEPDRAGPRRRLYELTESGRAGAPQVVADYRRRRPVPHVRLDPRGV